MNSDLKSEKNFCDFGGYIVNAKYRVTEDPTEFYTYGMEQVGCGRLFCPRCNKWVRNGIGFVLAEGARLNPGEIYREKDWNKLINKRVLEKDRFKEARLYVCECDFWLQRFCYEYLEDDSDKDPWDPKFVWRCAGHPRPNIPFILDGVMIGTDIDFKSLFKNIIIHGSADGSNAVGKELDIKWIQSLYVRLTGLPLAEKVSQAMAHLIEEPYTWCKSYAIWFFWCFPEASGVEYLAKKLKEDRDLLASMENPSDPESATFEESLTEVLVRHIKRTIEKQKEIDLEDLEQIRISALRPSKRSIWEVMELLGNYDSQWLIANAEDIARATEKRWMEVLWALSKIEYPDLEEMGSRLASLGLANHETIKEYIKTLPDKILPYTEDM